MTSKAIFFGEALEMATHVLQSSGLSSQETLVIRDIYGRIRIVLDSASGEKQEAEQKLKEGLTSLRAYKGGGEKPILYQNDFLDFQAIFNDQGILQVNLPGSDFSFRLLDRQIVGQDWLRPDLNKRAKPPRLVFYGFKGGVGRSTALVMLAYSLAKQNKRVLLLDLDLESPGLSGLLLPPERLADFGLVDWFVEDAVGQGDQVLPRMIASSPLATDLAGAIRIAAAFGSTGKDQYLAKLSRVYADTNQNGQQELFAHRVQRLVLALEEKEKPDVVLIDSRAGLHDLAAISLVGLSTTALLFAADNAQTWQGYHLLFSHWRAFPKTLKSIRDRLLMIQALLPEAEQAKRAESFLDQSYKLFMDNLYEEIAPDTPDEGTLFSYAPNDASAPHYPTKIRWNSRFQEFDPLLLAQGIFTEEDIRLTFGQFIDRVLEELDAASDE